MKSKISTFGSLLLLLNLLLVAPTFSQDLQIGLDIVIPGTTCNVGTLCLSCDGSFTFTGTGVATHIDLGYFNDDGDWVQEDLCNAYHAFFEDGDTQVYCDETFSYPNSNTVTVDNNMQLIFQYTTQDYFPDGIGCAEANEITHPVFLSDILATLEPECEEEAACPDGLSPSGGVEGFVDAYVAPSTETLTFSLNTFVVPDQLIVSVNCEQVIDSGPYTTSPTTSQISILNSNCGVGAYTNGNGANFFTSLEVNEGDNVTIQVIGDNCGFGGTAWTLDVTCGRRAPAIYNFGKLEDEPIKKEIDKLNTDSIDEFTLNTYPNPAKTQLTYELMYSETPYAITVFNADGKVMEKIINNGGKNELSLDQYPDGVYMIQAVLNEQVLTKKINVLK